MRRKIVVENTPPHRIERASQMLTAVTCDLRLLLKLHSLLPLVTKGLGLPWSNTIANDCFFSIFQVTCFSWRVHTQPDSLLQSALPLALSFLQLSWSPLNMAWTLHCELSSVFSTWILTVCSTAFAIEGAEKPQAIASSDALTSALTFCN